MIARQSDMEIVSAASTSEEAVDFFREFMPDVTLMDLKMPSAGGLEAIRVIRAEAPLARIIVLTTYEGDEDIFRALQAGAATYLLKDTLSDDLVRIVREVHAGGRPIPSNVEKLLGERVNDTTLTSREMDVMRLIARGFRNKEMAAELGISEETVKVHVKNVLAKLHVSDRSAAVAVAARRGIIHLS